MQTKILKAKTLIEALPYIQQFSGQTIVIKYGGSLMTNEELKPSFAQDIALLTCIGITPIVVHGGGKEISKWMNKVGKESRFVDGLRVTDSETMELTEMVLSGKINSEIVAHINHAGAKAVGLSGKDANLFQARKLDSTSDLGWVGTIDMVDANLLTTLCRQGYVPVISSVAPGQHAGETYNLNADHVAEAIARGTAALKLIYLTDVDGLLINQKLVHRLTLDAAEALLSHPDVQGGMKPKLASAISTVRGGVGSVHMINGGIQHAVLLEIFTDTGIGTMITLDTGEVR
ncbi:acetylglutamate kinase [bacterium]|nr:acetylglutamate kinase [bacterium]